MSKLIGDAVHDSDMERFIAQKHKFGNDPIHVGDIVEFLDFKSEGSYPNIMHQPYIRTCKVMPHEKIEIPEEDKEYWGEGVKYYPINENEFEVNWKEDDKSHTFLNAKKKYLRKPISKDAVRDGLIKSYPDVEFPHVPDSSVLLQQEVERLQREVEMLQTEKYKTHLIEVDRLQKEAEKLTLFMNEMNGLKLFKKGDDEFDLIDEALYCATRYWYDHEKEEDKDNLNKLDIYAIIIKNNLNA